jgi:hypothetical protein
MQALAEHAEFIASTTGFDLVTNCADEFFCHAENVARLAQGGKENRKVSRRTCAQGVN